MPLINTDRAKQSTAIFWTFWIRQERRKNRQYQYFLDMNAPKDEGNFGTFDLILGTLT